MSRVSKGKVRYLRQLYRRLYGWVKIDFTITDLSDVLLDPIDQLPMRMLFTEKGPV